MEAGTPFSVNILTLALYLRFTHAISYQRLTRLFLHLFALRISEGALDAMFRRAKPCFDNEVLTSLPACVARASSVPTRLRYGLVGGPTGTGCSKTTKW
jgi:hypothetical protein